MAANAVDLCVAGEESYLVKDEGLANLCARSGHPVLGAAEGIRPTWRPARSSPRRFLQRHRHPDRPATATDSLDEAISAIGGEYPNRPEVRRARRRQGGRGVPG
jgi:phosphoribosylamine---glycine ligase